METSKTIVLLCPGRLIDGYVIHGANMDTRALCYNGTILGAAYLLLPISFGSAARVSAWGRFQPTPLPRGTVGW